MEKKLKFTPIDAMKSINGRGNKRLDILNYVHVKETGLITVTNLDVDYTTSTEDLGIELNQGLYQIVGNEYCQALIDTSELIDNIKIGSKHLARFSVDMDLIKELFSFTSNDEIRPQVQGIQIKQFGYFNKLVLSATDSYMLKSSLINDVRFFTEDGVDFILKKELLKAMVKSKAKTFNINLYEDGCEVSDNDLQNWVLRSKYMDENYPDVEGVVPRKALQEIKVTTKELKDALNTVKPFANKYSCQMMVNCDIDKGILRLSCTDNDRSVSREVSIKANFKKRGLLVPNPFEVQLISSQRVDKFESHSKDQVNDYFSLSAKLFDVSLKYFNQKYTVIAQTGILTPLILRQEN